MEAYICPNDRQLALRARLGTGWSSRSSSSQGQGRNRLTTEEEEQILRVLRRNEVLKQVDEIRIKLMLQRLDSMKHDCQSHSRKECALCRQAFGRITNLPTICADCGRHVCSSCMSEVQFNSARKHMHSTGNEWVSVVPGAASLQGTPLKRTSSTVTTLLKRSRHDSELGGTSLTNGTGRGLTPMERLANATGLVTTNGQGLLQFVQQRGRNRLWGRKIYICKLCREAHEVWKRSGAWFYKMIPTEQINSCPSTPLPRSTSVHSPGDLVGQVFTFSPEQESDEWVQLKPKVVNRLENTIEQQSDDLQKPTGISQLSPKDAHESTSAPCAKTSVSPSYSKKWSPIFTSSKTPFQSSESFPVDDAISVSERMNHLSQSVMPTTPPAVPSSHLPNRPLANQKKAGTLTASMLASSFNNINQSKKIISLMGEENPAQLTKPSPSGNVASRTSTDDAPLGVLYFTLYHDTINKQLHVAIHKAKNLIAMDANGLSDPYVVCQVLPGSQQSPRPRTSTRPQCLNPVWNEALTFEPFDEKSIHQKTLRLAVLDEDLYGSDWLGEYWLPLSRLAPDRLTDFAVSLGPRKPLQRGEFDLACPTRGKLQLGLRYIEDKHQLCVEVLRCSDLAPMDPNGSSDPFVKLAECDSLREIFTTGNNEPTPPDSNYQSPSPYDQAKLAPTSQYLRPDKGKKTKQKTQVKRNTLYPEFNERFFYVMNASDAGSRTLEVTVWDFDRGQANDFIGGLTLGAGAKAERRELWLAVFRPPFRRIEAWFQLSSRSDVKNDMNTSTPGICD